MAETQKRLRLDRSRDFGTIHGERTPGDPHQNAHFSQDGIIFDAHGLHIDDLIEDPKIRALVDRRLKKLSAPKAEVEADASDDGDSDPVPKSQSSNEPSDVNLEAWLRGEAKYPWFAITKTVRDRYSQNISKQADMVAFLVLDEKVIPEGEVAQDLLGLLPKSAA